VQHTGANDLVNLTLLVPLFIAFVWEQRFLDPFHQVPRLGYRSISWPAADSSDHIRTIVDIVLYVLMQIKWQRYTRSLIAGASYRPFVMR